MFGDGFVRLGMDEWRKGVKKLVRRMALPELFGEDPVVEKPRRPRGRDDHRLGPSAQHVLDLAVEIPQHHLCLVLHDAGIAEGDVLQRLRDQPLRELLLLVGSRHV